MNCPVLVLQVAQYFPKYDAADLRGLYGLGHTVAVQGLAKFGEWLTARFQFDRDWLKVEASTAELMTANVRGYLGFLVKHMAVASPPDLQVSIVHCSCDGRCVGGVVGVQPQLSIAGCLH